MTTTTYSPIQDLAAMIHDYLNELKQYTICGKVVRDCTVELSHDGARIDLEIGPEEYSDNPEKKLLEAVFRTGSAGVNLTLSELGSVLMGDLEPKWNVLINGQQHTGVRMSER